MSRKNHILNLVLKYTWFDKIKSGEKTSEYRECSPKWDREFENFQHCYDFVRFNRGYNKPEQMLFEIKEIKHTTEKNDFNLPKCWEIKLGRRIS